MANPSRIPWLFRDGRKNDAIDARKLATLLYLNQVPTVHLPTADVSAWRALINHRRTLVKRSTMIKSQLRSILRGLHYRCPHRSCWTRIGRVWLGSLTFDSARTLMVGTLLDELGFVEGKRRRVEIGPLVSQDGKERIVSQGGVVVEVFVSPGNVEDPLAMPKTRWRSSVLRSWVVLARSRGSAMHSASSAVRPSCQWASRRSRAPAPSGQPSAVEIGGDFLSAKTGQRQR